MLCENRSNFALNCISDNKTLVTQFTLWIKQTRESHTRSVITGFLKGLSLLKSLCRMFELRSFRYTQHVTDYLMKFYFIYTFIYYTFLYARIPLKKPQVTFKKEVYWMRCVMWMKDEVSKLKQVKIKRTQIDPWLELYKY